MYAHVHPRTHTHAERHQHTQKQRNIQWRSKSYKPAADMGVTVDQFTSVLLCAHISRDFFSSPSWRFTKSLFLHSVSTHVFVSPLVPAARRVSNLLRCLKSQASLQAKPLLGLHPCFFSPLPLSLSSSLCLPLSSARCRSDSQCTSASAAALTLHTLQGNFNRIYWQAGRECA